MQSLSTYLMSFGAVEAINTALALTAAAVAFRSINLLHGAARGLAFGFITLSVGLFGQALGSLIPGGWQLALDTLLYGGALALLLANQRTTALGENIQKIALGVSAASWAVFFVAVS